MSAIRQNKTVDHDMERFAKGYGLIGKVGNQTVLLAKGIASQGVELDKISRELSLGKTMFCVESGMGYLKLKAIRIVHNYTIVTPYVEWKAPAIQVDHPWGVA